MPQDSYSFAQARVRLEEIVAQVRKKDVSLEKSLDLLEEGVRLANQCTELIDRADWEAAVSTETGEPTEGDDELGADEEAEAAEAGSERDGASQGAATADDKSAGN